MSLDHDFILVSAEELGSTEYSELARREGAVHLHDDLVAYLHDSLRWIPTINPAMADERGLGLNTHGVTAILHDAAGQAAEVFHCWAELFRLGPDILSLTGQWTAIAGEPESGSYARIAFSRDAVVLALEGISDACREVARSEGAAVLFHCGI